MRANGALYATNPNAAGLIANFYTPDYSPGTTGSNLLLSTGANSGNTWFGWQTYYNGLAAYGVSLLLQPYSGQVAIGTTAPGAGAILDMVSTTQGVGVPRMTTAQKNAITSIQGGLLVFDTTLQKLCHYASGGWKTITST
jgi:hypothetical protein